MKRPAFLEQRVITPRPRTSHRAVNFVIILAIVALLVILIVRIFAYDVVAGAVLCAILFSGGVVLLAGLFMQARQHKKKLGQMKWEAWLTAVDDRDIGGDLDFKDPAESLYLREKFEAGCSPYEAIAAWRHRQARDRKR